MQFITATLAAATLLSTIASAQFQAATPAIAMSWPSCPSGWYPMIDQCGNRQGKLCTYGPGCPSGWAQMYSDDNGGTTPGQCYKCPAGSKPMNRGQSGTSGCYNQSSYVAPPSC